MDSNDLTREQWKQLAESFHRQGMYLRKLIERMHSLCFPHTDRLWIEVQAAFNANHSLWVHAHYGSCGIPDTGHPPGRESPPGPPDPMHEEISKRIAPAVEAANKHRRWRR